METGAERGCGAFLGDERGRGRRIRLNKKIFGENTMTSKNKGNYAKKHPSDRKADPNIAEAVKKRVTDGKISCAAAFGIVKESKGSPAEVGFTIDTLEIPIIKCQLGLFGYHPQRVIVKPADSVPSALEDAIRQALVNGRLPCAAAWQIADRLGLRKMQVSSACERLKIKISSCQLGSF